MSPSPSPPSLSSPLLLRHQCHYHHQLQQHFPRALTPTEQCPPGCFWLFPPGAPAPGGLPEAGYLGHTSVPAWQRFQVPIRTRRMYVAHSHRSSQSSAVFRVTRVQHSICCSPYPQMTGCPATCMGLDSATPQQDTTSSPARSLGCCTGVPCQRWRKGRWEASLPQGCSGAVSFPNPQPSGWLRLAPGLWATLGLGSEGR